MSLQHRIIFALLCSFNVRRVQCSLELKKCCKDQQVFDIESESCIAAFDNNATRYPIDPAIIAENDEEVFFNLRGNGLPICPYGTKRSFLLNHPDSVSFYVDNFDGSLIDAEAGKDHQTFCIDRGFVVGQHKGTIAVVCQDEPEIACRTKPCVRQCCPPPLVYDVGLSNCRESLAEVDDPRAIFNPFITSTTGGSRVNAVKAGAIFLHGNPTCPLGAHKFNLTRQEDLIILDSGGLRIKGGLYDHTEYCVNHVEEGDGLRYWSQAVVCVRRWENLVDFRLVSALLMVSIAFLTALAGREIARGGTAKLFGAMRLCAIVMLIVLYVNLSAVCWMNAMSFSVWFNFRNVRTAAATVSRIDEDRRRRPTSGFRNKKFKWFALYAWGLPTVVLTVTLTMQLVGRGSVLPGIGATRCFLAKGWPTLVYFHAVTFPVLLSNCLFFLLFLHNLLFGVWATKSRDPMVREQHRTRLKIVAKMFFVVGVTWICDVASWALEWAYGRGNATVYRFASFFKVVNALQGVVLFAVVFFDSETVRRCVELCRCNGNRGGAPAAKNKEPEVEKATEEMTKMNALEMA